jgi:hypothetical protein
MDEHQVAQILGLLDNGLWVTPGRIRFLAQLSEIYECQGVLTNDGAPALHKACPDANVCWALARDRISTGAKTLWPGEEDGSIFWPWIGEKYLEGGVCIVGMNINHGGDWWSVTDEYAIEREQLAQLEAGHRANAKHSLFAYRSAATAAALLASLDGSEPIEEPEPQTAGAALQRISRLQAVKCSPLGDKSTPTKPMGLACPPRYFIKELAVLRPSVLIGFGEEAEWAIKQAGGVTLVRADDHYKRSRISLRAGGTAEVFVLPHPAAFGSLWAKGQAALVADLLKHPVGKS